MVLPWANRRLSGWVIAALLVGCGERDRLTFPSDNQGNGAGPVTEIDHPAAPDTVVVEGDPLVLQGRTFDPDGVDTVYFEVGGTNQGFAPKLGEGADTVNFALQFSTLNHSGATFLVRAYGVDKLGDLGNIVSRQIRVE
jgi:hypothetical protein